MKSFDRLAAVIVVLMAGVFALVNILFLTVNEPDPGLRKVEVQRVVRMISETGEIPDTSGFATITGVYGNDDKDRFFESDSDYVIREVNGRLYRVEYSDKRDTGSALLYVNITLAIFCAVVIAILLYIRHSVIKPFDRMLTLPYELAKGNLTTPLEESKSRYFGKFLWGLDMLREKTEKSKQAELALQKEKKTMMMSLSHDIKTPLSAIKLYSAALSKGIYTDGEKQREAAVSIGEKADEIERLAAEIMKSGSEDIMQFDVKDGEFYLSDVINSIRSYYLDRLTGTEFTVGKLHDCIINGDTDRLTEVLQNIIENAIKYGDGRSISVSFSDEENCRLITITNSGCTLPEAELTHIFDSFWRGSNVGSKSGSGLGLYICKQLMNAMNGDIFAESHGGDMLVTVVCRKK